MDENRGIDGTELHLSEFNLLIGEQIIHGSLIELTRKIQQMPVNFISAIISTSNSAIF